METKNQPLPSMFDLLKIMIAAVGEEIVDAAITRTPGDVIHRDQQLTTLFEGGRDTQVLTEACAVLIRRRAML